MVNNGKSTKEYNFNVDDDIYFVSFKIGDSKYWDINFGYHNFEKEILYDYGINESLQNDSDITAEKAFNIF